jgi:glutamate/tyrosine decarboxylase-like PLP-dependent enzyme
VTDAREAIEAGVVKLGFRVLGRPQLGIVSFTHDEVDPFAVWGKLFERGWFTSLTTEPKGLHLMLSPFHASVTDTYLTDLEWALGEVKAGNAGKKREARYS